MAATSIEMDAIANFRKFDFSLSFLHKRGKGQQRSKIPEKVVVFRDLTNYYIQLLYAVYFIQRFHFLINQISVWISVQVWLCFKNHNSWKILGRWRVAPDCSVQRGSRQLRNLPNLERELFRHQKKSKWTWSSHSSKTLHRKWFRRPKFVHFGRWKTQLGRYA